MHNVYWRTAVVDTAWHPRSKCTTKFCLERFLVVTEHTIEKRTTLRGEGKLEEQVTIETHYST